MLLYLTSSLIRIKKKSKSNFSCSVAAPCDFLDENVDSFICDQLIDNFLATNLKTKLLAEGHLNLDRALDIAKTMEAWESQSRQIAEDNQFAV